MKPSIIRVMGVIFGLSSAVAVVARENCILLKVAGEVEQITPGGKGRKALAPAERIEPGGKVIYTVSAANICEQPADPVLIEVPVPDHMTYVAGSAIGPGAEVSFSVDGGFQYGKPEALKAAPKDYTHIRWAMKSPLEPGAVAFARFRAIFE